MTTEKNLKRISSLLLAALMMEGGSLRAFSQVEALPGAESLPTLPVEGVPSAAPSLPAGIDAAPSLSEAPSLSLDGLTSEPRPLPAVPRLAGEGKAEQTRSVPSASPEASLGRIFDQAGAASFLPVSLGAAPEPSCEPDAEAQLGKISVSYALEVVLEDIPDGREKVLAALSDDSIPELQRERFFSQFSTRLAEAVGREGVPADMLPVARQFLSQVAAGKAPAAARTQADRSASELDRPRPGLPAELAPAAEALKAAGIVPIASLAREAAASGVGGLVSLKAELEKREPDLFDDREVDVYYSVLSHKIDIRNSGYYGYRKRVDAARAFVREAGLKPEQRPKLPSFSLTNAYQPFDVSGVDRSVIASARDNISGAHRRVSSLVALSDLRLAALRDELIRRTWAYVKNWPQIENEPRSRDAQGRAVPIPSKQIRAFLTNSAADVSTEAMESELRGSGRYLFVGLQAAISHVLAGSKPSEEQKQALYELMADNMLAYQWTDDVARAELNIGDDPSAWSPVEIKLALDRIGYIYFDKSQEFQAFKTGIFAPAEVKAILGAGRKAAKEQLERIIVNKRAAKDETVVFEPASGVAGLFRGFCGRDCSKSLAPERGRLVLRAFQPHSAAYLGMVEGKAVGYVQLFEAVANGRKVLLAEILQFPEREAMTPKLLEALDRVAKQRGYAGLAVPANLHPWDPVAKENTANFTNFHQTVKSVKNLKAWQEGDTFKPEFPWAGEMAAIDARLGRVPYYSWGVADGTYKLLKFEP